MDRMRHAYVSERLKWGTKVPKRFQTGSRFVYHIRATVMSFAYALLALNLLATRQVPPGTQLHIRLLTAIGSYASRAGDPVSAVLIAPVLSNGQVILPEGSLLSGTIKSVQRVGLGFIH